MLTAAYVASEIVLPLIFAVMLNLLIQPALHALEGLRVPRALGALLLILVVIVTIVGLGAAVSGPAEAWIAKLPEGIPRILERLRFLGFGAAGPQRSSPGPFDGGAILTSVFAGTRSFAAGLATTVIFLYFLLVSGDSFLRRLVEVLPRFASKRAGGRHLTANRPRYFRLVLLCHKLARWQQGQRGKRRAMLRASLIRIVAIDALMWRSARIGGSAGSITRG